MTTSIIKNKWFRCAVSFAFWISLWYLLALAIGSELFLPYPHTTVSAFIKLLTENYFWKSIGNSFSTILSGALVGITLGIFLGAVAAYFPLGKSIITPFITVLRATPVASFIILVYVIVRKIKLEISFVSFLIVVIMVIPIVYTNLYTAFTSFDKKLSEVAYIFRFSRWKKISVVYFPQIRPYLFAAIQNSLGFAWKAGVAAEVICGLSFTIGQSLSDAKTNLEMDLLFGWTVTVILLSLLFEYLFKVIVSKSSRRGGVKM